MGCGCTVVGDSGVRADGSSKFGPNRKWGYFPAVGAPWRVKQESFLKDVTVISDLKLRASYGVTGNQNGIDDFASRGLWSGGTPYGFGRYRATTVSQ